VLYTPYSFVPRREDSDSLMRHSTAEAGIGPCLGKQINIGGRWHGASGVQASLSGEEASSIITKGNRPITTVIIGSTLYRPGHEGYFSQWAPLLLLSSPSSSSLATNARISSSSRA
jgi:hypothetical protein